MNVQSPLTDDQSILEIADFNGSKALKVTPKSDVAGTIEKIGIDVSSLLGDKVADVAMVRMQIGVEGADGNFYPCTGTVFQNFSDAGGQNWVAYSKNKNPNEVEMSFSASYDKSAKNVLQIKKDTNSGNNSDTAYGKTGKYSTLYIDNIVFYDKDTNPIEVNTAGGFEEPDGFNKADWSNLIQVENQVIIPGFSASDVAGWAQKPDWITNYHEEDVRIPAVDENGDPILNERGKPTYVTKKDADGNDLLDEDGKVIYETEKKTVGNFDWASIMKPGTVFTLYFSAEESTDLNQYIWFVLAYGDYGLGWNRILDAPTAANDGILREDDAATKKGHLFAVNDSFTMAQVTYEEIVQYIADHYADSLPEGVTAQDIKWDGNFGFQAEAGMKWSLTAVTYALDQKY
jgi:hypothetical protein